MSAMPDEADEPILCWSVGRGKNTARWSLQGDRSWSDFVEWLDPDDPASHKEFRPYVGGTLARGRRTEATVQERFLLTLDADYADEDLALDVATLLTDCPYVMHTTWRHTPESQRYRLVIPLSRGVTPNEYKGLAWAVMERLGGEQFDKTTAQAERFMWGPSTQDPEEYWWDAPNVGSPYLPVDAWLSGQQQGTSAPADGAGAHTPTPAPATVTSVPEPTEEDVERATEILVQACEDVEHVHERGEFGGRNEAVFHLLPLLFRFVDADVLEEDTVLDALWTASQRVDSDEPYTRTEFNMSVRSARKYADEQGPVLPETTPSKLAAKDFEDTGELWERTDQLRHVAQAADSMGRNRYALLATLLTRILVEVEPGVCLPGVEEGAVGSHAPLNLGVALVGASGQGKSAFKKLSQRLLGRDQRHLEQEPSTGQGLIQLFLEWDDDLKENVLIPDPRRLLIIDEIDKVGALAADSGSTLMAEIRTFLTGGSTGTANATAERKRMIHAETYNFQLVIGVQPARAGALLSGRDAGTPQRFIWANVTDPDTALHPDDRPEWPGPLEWSDAFLLGFEVGDPIVEYPDWLKAELRDYDYRVSLEGPEGGEMSWFGHQNLLRLKVAAGIAFLHQSPVIEDDHVEIADMIIKASRKVQLHCERVITENKYLAAKAKVQTDDSVRGDLRDEKFDGLMESARKHLHRAEGEWVTWQTLRPPYRDREEWGETVWNELEMDELIETEETEFGSRTRRRARWIT